MATDNDKVVVLKDYVPAWVKDAYLTKEEIDTWNEEYDSIALNSQQPAPTQSEKPAPEFT